MYKYSASTGGFYTSEIHGTNMPHDAVEISEQQHSELMIGQSLGLSIAADEGGYPVIIGRPGPTYQSELVELNRAHQACTDLLSKQFAVASLSDGASEESKKTSIRAAYQDANTKFAADRAALKAKYGIGDA